MLSYNETKELIELVLSASLELARANLHRQLERRNSKEGEFYESIAKHAGSMGLSSEEWFDLLSKLPNRVLRSQLSLNKFLSQEQIKRLPPVTG